MSHSRLNRFLRLRTYAYRKVYGMPLITTLDQSRSSHARGFYQDFLSTPLICCMEVLCPKGQFQGMADVRKWLQVSMSSLLMQSPYERMSWQQSPISQTFSLLPDNFLAKSLWRLADHLRYMGRREDTLKAIQEAVELYQQLSAICPKA